MATKTDITTKTARARLRVQNTIYWKALKPGQLHLGYAKRKAGAGGTWIMRTYLGVDARGIGRHQKQNIGIADDVAEADGTEVLSYVQTQQKALDLHGQRQKAQSGPLTVRDVTDAYLAHLRAAGQPADDAERRIRTHILPAFGNTKVDDLTTHRLTKWRDAMAADPARIRTRPGQPQRFRAPPTTSEQKRARRATVNRTVTVLKASLNRAFKAGRLHDDLAWRRLEPFGKVDARRPGFLSIIEAKQLIDAADAASGFRDVVRAALFTGCRYGELCRFVVGDFQRGRIVVQQSKTDKPRDVRLLDDGIAFFTQLCAGRASGETMLLRPDKSPWGKSQQARLMRIACVAAGIKPIGIHQLRHTWASQAVMGRMPLMLVAESLGHSSTRMCEKFYAHLVDDFRDEMFRQHAPRFGEANVVALDPLREAKQ